MGRGSLKSAVGIVICAGALAAPACSAEPSRSPSERGSSEHSDERSGGDAKDDALASAIECLQGEWREDMTNLLAQWQSGSPSIAALPITGVDGQNTLRVSETSMEYTLGQIARMTMPAGPGFTGEAVTSGSATFAYDVASTTAMTVGPVTAQSVTSVTRVYIGGQLSTETPGVWDGGIEGDAVWWCEGDTLSLEPSVSGWIHLFARVS